MIKKATSQYFENGRHAILSEYCRQDFLNIGSFGTMFFWVTLSRKEEGGMAMDRLASFK